MTLAALSVGYEMHRCPFCQGERTRVHSYRSHGEHFVVLCLNPACEARGPRRYDAQSAMDAWNSLEMPQ